MPKFGCSMASSGSTWRNARTVAATVSFRAPRPRARLPPWRLPRPDVGSGLRVERDRVVPTALERLRADPPGSVRVASSLSFALAMRPSKASTTVRAFSKSSSAARRSRDVTVPGRSGTARTWDSRSVQLAGINERDSSGKINRRWSSPARLQRLRTSSAWPSNACPLRRTRTVAGTSWRWVACRVFL